MKHQPLPVSACNDGVHLDRCVRLETPKICLRVILALLLWTYQQRVPVAAPLSCRLLISAVITSARSTWRAGSE